MANEAQNPCLSLPQVLAAEFEQLHGHAPSIDFTASDADQLKQYWAAVHSLEEKQAALCFSGGGIRSATFGLGILQGRARVGLLQKFHDLSTVSGGGYIGGLAHGVDSACGTRPRRSDRETRATASPHPSES